MAEETEKKPEILDQPAPPNKGRRGAAKKPPGEPRGESGGAREARLAEALRANLRRRKKAAAPGDGENE